MAITVTKQTLVDGKRIIVVKLHLVSGAAADVSGQKLIDISDFAFAPKEVKIMQIEAGGSDMDIELLWDGSPSVKITTLPLPSGYSVHDYRQVGGLINNAIAPTGDINFNTRGAAADSEGTILLYLKIKS